MENKLNNDEVVAKIKELVEKINITSNPDELEELKTLIRKNVPFTRRRYFTAMLLKIVLSNDKGAVKKNVNNETKKEYKAPDGAVTLYFNIGKMKNLYPQDLSSFIQSELKINKEDIFMIRVHDKYSFVTLSKENSEKAINNLNGKVLKGRTLSVSLAH